MDQLKNRRNETFPIATEWHFVGQLHAYTQSKTMTVSEQFAIDLFYTCFAYII